MKVYTLSGRAVLSFSTEDILADSLKEAVAKFLDGQAGIATDDGYDYDLSSFKIESCREYKPSKYDKE